MVTREVSFDQLDSSLYHLKLRRIGLEA
jgi:hypothetical protein